MRTAALFPGQGSHTDDMRDVVERHRPDLLELALGKLGEDVFARTSESTEYAQPAIYCASLAGWERMGGGADVLAGHSLGELAALAAAGSLDHHDGFMLAVLRGRAMQRAARGGGGMVAVGVGVEEARALAARHGLTMANDNSPEQTVLSGNVEALDAALEEAKERGLRAKRLPLGGAFHSAAMTDARRELERAVAATDFAPPKVPVLSCVTAAPLTDPRSALAEGVTSPVRWRETLLALRDSGVERYVDVGPGRVLAGLVRRTLGDVEATMVERAAVAGV